MRKELNTKLIPIQDLILELESLSIDATELKEYDLICKVNCYDVLNNNNYLIKNMYEIIDKEGHIISYYIGKDFKIIKK